MYSADILIVYSVFISAIKCDVSILFKIFITYFGLAFRLITVNRKIMLERALHLGISHVFA